jgi:HPt (histidine-containing phosphotransfer) domain-containing protein
LSQIMHQLRGAAATYGFPGLAELAGSVEIALASPVFEEAVISESMTSVKATCKRIEVGMALLTDT